MILLGIRFVFLYGVLTGESTVSRGLGEAWPLYSPSTFDCIEEGQYCVPMTFCFGYILPIHSNVFSRILQYSNIYHGFHIGTTSAEFPRNGMTALCSSSSFSGPHSGKNKTFSLKFLFINLSHEVESCTVHGIDFSNAINYCRKV